MLPELRLVDGELVHLDAQALRRRGARRLRAGFVAQQRRLPHQVDQQGDGFLLQAAGGGEDAVFIGRASQARLRTSWRSDVHRSCLEATASGGGPPVVELAADADVNGAAAGDICLRGARAAWPRDACRISHS